MICILFLDFVRFAIFERLLQQWRSEIEQYVTFRRVTARNKKHLMTGPEGKQWVLFPLDLNVSLGFALGNIEGLGETKLTVSHEARL